MDGVLVDNIPVHLRAFAESARRHGVTIDLTRVLAMSGMGNNELFEATFPREVVERTGLKALADEKEQIYREMFAPQLTPAGGLVRFLEQLKAAGVKIAVGTSGTTANLDFVLDGLAIRPYFDALVDGDMVTHTKPDPEIYLTAAARLGLEPSECVVFEDALAGIEAAHAAGIRVVALSTSVDKATLAARPGVMTVIKDFTEINPDRIKNL